MNEVNLRFRVFRQESSHVRVECIRDGQGDDMVEQRADFLEHAVKFAIAKLVTQNGGTISGGKPEESR